jgi:hypothetical protein
MAQTAPPLREDPMERLRASAATRAAAPPDALDVIASFGLRPVTGAAINADAAPNKAEALPPLMGPTSPWLRGLACDTQLWRDQSFSLAPFADAAATQPQPLEMRPFDLSALQAAFTFRPSVVQLAEVRCVRGEGGRRARVR